jgi:dienelactone hydrolase
MGEFMRISIVLLMASLVFPYGVEADSVKHGVSVTAADGVRLAGDFYPSGKSGPGILLFHQCSRERVIWDHLANTLAASGHNVLVLNPRGIGDSQGAQWDYDGNLDHALDYWRKNWSADAESAYQWLVSQPNVKRDEIVAMGAGCGSFLALLTAERHYPLVRNVVFFSDFDDDSTRQFLQNAPQLSILSAVSEQDPMSFTAAKDIHALAKNRANRLFTYTEQAHGFRLLEEHPELESTVVAWIEERLTATAVDPRVAEILKIHELDRAAHLHGDANDLCSRLAPELFSVDNGKLTRSSREDNRKRFTKYFGSAQHRLWDDVEPPVIRVSPDANMAWAVYRVHSQYLETKPDGTQKTTNFTAAWMSTYEKQDGQWLMTAVTSTFEPAP